jgi:hypothetical protein
MVNEEDLATSTSIHTLILPPASLVGSNSNKYRAKKEQNTRTEPKHEHEKCTSYSFKNLSLAFWTLLVTELHPIVLHRINCSIQPSWLHLHFLEDKDLQLHATLNRLLE